MDSKGRKMVRAYDVPVRCGEVLVNPGDLIFADFDGVVAIPRKVEAEVLRLPLKKSASKTNHAEHSWRAENFAMCLTNSEFCRAGITCCVFNSQNRGKKILRQTNVGKPI